MYRSYLASRLVAAGTITLPSESSALSPGVKELVLGMTFSEVHDANVLDHNGSLDFAYIASKFPDEDKAGEDSAPYFRRCVTELAPMLQSVEERLQASSAAELNQQYDHHVQWTGQPKLVMERFSAMADHCHIGDLTSLLTVSAILERALGDLYLTSASGPCPSMLRDLLVTPQLRHLLGADVIVVLRIMIGPPISLNLRNLAWHGFPVPGELPRRCIWFILLLVPSIGQVLHNHNLQVDAHREPVVFPHIKPPDNRLFREDIQPWLTWILPSRFVTWKTDKFWQTVKQLYDQERFGHCAALLLFYLEQGLRRVFATVNNCPQRILTAESTVLFTTFTEIYSQYLPDGTANKLPKILGEPVMELLFDLLLYQDGPRVRDHLSHGEADWDMFPRDMVDWLGLCTVSLSAMFVCEPAAHNEEVELVLSEVSRYESQFHRIDLIRQMVQSMITGVYNIDETMCFYPDLQERTPHSPYVTDTQLLGKITGVMRHMVALTARSWSIPYTEEDIFNSISCLNCNEGFRSVTESILKTKIRTLYRIARNQFEDISLAADREGEIIGLLFHVAMETVKVVKQLQETLHIRQAQLKNRELRSRQRDNFKTFLSRCPVYMTTTNFLAMMTTWQLQNLDSLHTLSENCLKQRVKVFRCLLNPLSTGVVAAVPDNILPTETQSKFKDLLHKYDDVFNSDISGYNGAVGPFEASVNMGPVQPPQRKGRLPQYARNKLVELQEKFDELESQGIFRRPEDIGVNIEYLNPSFLVKKASGGFRLVTAFADVGRYSKPQPSVMPDVDSTLRTIAQWKYIIVTDLTSAFYQIPLAKSSMKYCGMATPFRGVRVYTRCAMGMPGSETALEELMCRVLGDHLQDGIVAKLADDLYCGGNSPQELFENWERVLQSLQKCNLSLSPSKTTISPRSATILGWVWSQGCISASPHRIAVLSSCSPPDTVRGMRSFIGAYKMLSRVLPSCSQLIGPLDDAIAGKQSGDKISWTENLNEHFVSAQKSLDSHKSITLPKSTDQLWIVTDGSVGKRGIGATLYVTRNEKLSLAGFFSAKLRKHQVTWLPCEVEALCIAAAVKHFSPYIIQSNIQACVLTDSKPCVQAFDKLCRGEFSASPRVTSFLSVVSRYQVNLRHLSGAVNIPSDFASRNAPDCDEPRCQICCFVARMEDSVVRTVNVQDILENDTKLPFTTRSAWIDVQSACPDLRRANAHLKQGTRPSKKLTNIKDVKRYLHVASIAKDGLMIVRRCDPLSPSTELIIVPRNVLDGLVTALHIKLDHPSKHQLHLVLKRHFYALDLMKAVDIVCDSCHLCASLKRFPDSLVKQSSEDPPETIGMSFAADVIKRNRQLILVVRETVTSFTTASIINDEKRDTLRDGLAQSLVDLHPMDGPNAVVRVDPAPGFVALKDDDTLKRLCISIEIGRVKNVNKNPVAEKAIFELEDELLRQEPGGGPVSKLGLAIATARLNSRIRQYGLSAREMWTQRSQFTHEQLPISDRDVIISQHDSRAKNHSYSEKSKSQKAARQSPTVKVGDLVYLYSDRSKNQARSRYIVVSINGEWCCVKKFSGNQLRATSYKVKLSECYQVASQTTSDRPKTIDLNDSCDEDEFGYLDESVTPPEPADIPPMLIHPADEQPTNREAGPQPVLIGTMEPIERELPLDVTYEHVQLPVNIYQQNGAQARPQRIRKRPNYLQDYVP